MLSRVKSDINLWDNLVKWAFTMRDGSADVQVPKELYEAVEARVDRRYRRNKQSQTKVGDYYMDL
jgi:hypothetical protein